MGQRYDDELRQRVALWRVAFAAGNREGARGRSEQEAVAHGVKLARAYAKRHAATPAEYASMVLDYGRTFMSCIENAQGRVIQRGW